MEIKEYFKMCENNLPGKSTLLRRSCLALRRNGLETMEELCRLRLRSPELLDNLRGIGPKTASLIFQICDRYREEYGDESKEKPPPWKTEETAVT